MNGHPAAAYLGGGLQQQFPTFLCGPSGPAIPRTLTLDCFPTQGFCPLPTQPHICAAPPVHTFHGLVCSMICAQDPYVTVVCTVAQPQCITIPWPRIPDLPGPGPGPLAAAPMQMMAAAAPDCKNVMWTAGCTFAGQQAGAADCKHVLWTAGCTFAGAQAPGAGQITVSFGCPTGFATAQTLCFICPPPPCRPILNTRLCTVFGPLADTASAELAQDCKHVLWTAGCTFAGAQLGMAAAAVDCGKVLTTLACTLAAGGGARAQECGNVLTTLACTLAAQATPAANAKGSPMCITVFTHAPTWCQPDTGGADCKHVLWTAGCTFAGARGGVGCAGVGGTIACTFGAAQPQAGGEECGNVLTTLACTLTADRMPKALGGNVDCKDVLWTAGCTFQQLGKGERCGDVLTTLVCTLAAAPAQGKQAAVDCKDVLWTAGCTFAVTPSERPDGCKEVAWTLGCTF